MKRNKTKIMILFLHNISILNAIPNISMRMRYVSTTHAHSRSLANTDGRTISIVGTIKLAVCTFFAAGFVQTVWCEA